MNCSTNLYDDLCDEKKLNNIVTVLKSDYDDLFYILLNLPKSSRSICKGISIRIIKVAGRFIIETALLGNYLGSIFNANLIYDSESEYDDTKGFIETDDLVDEIIRVYNFYLNK